MSVLRRQQNMMVQIVDDLLHRVAESDEVEDVTVLVKRAGKFDGRAPVVAMQPFADVAVESNEVRGAEDQMIFGNSHTEFRIAHGRLRFARGLSRRCRGTSKRGRSGKQAVGRIGVGFKRCQFDAVAREHRELRVAIDSPPAGDLMHL